MATELTTTGGALPVAAEPMEEGNVSGLVRLAIERGVDVEVLERLVGLQERVTERNARGAYFEALADFQERCPEIRKSKKANIATRNGADYEYTYAPLEEITRTIRPILRECGLSYSWDVAQGDGALIVTCVLRHIEGHAERASFPVPVDSGARMSAAQKNGAALTYGRRQSLIAVLGLTTADPDTDAPAVGKSVETITEAQAADLRTLMDEVLTTEDQERFLGWMGVRTVEEVPASEYKRAVRGVEAKRAK